MENYEYNNLIINHELDKLANINNTNDLVDYRYLQLYLIEYLLREGIHTKIMDSRTQHSGKWINFYLKYNILKPLLNCYLRPLLETVDGKLILDSLLEKLNDTDKMTLLTNLKANSYWELHDYENEIINIYQKHGINIPRLFVKKPTVLDSKLTETKRNKELIQAFSQAFKDTNSYVLNIYLHELKKRLKIDNKRAQEDIRKLINHKKKNKEFVLQISNDTEGVYNGVLKTITTSPRREGVLTHELSHLMYQEFDKYNYHQTEYDKLRKKVTNKETIAKIVAYLKVFHERFNNMQDYFEKLYYHEIKRKYGSYNNYIKAVCEDIYHANPDIIVVDNDSLYFYIDKDNILDVATELLIIEKKEYTVTSARNYYTEELMLENLLDALLKGAICDGKLDIECLSGHIGRDFAEDKDLSFDESLADYDTIKNSKKHARLLNDLESLIGKDLIAFFDNYLEKNRGIKHGI